MPTDRPQVLVACSTAAKAWGAEVARALEEIGATPRLWPAEFRAGRYPLGELNDLLHGREGKERLDGAVILVCRDVELVKSSRRPQKRWAPSPNVVLEIGACMATFGSEGTAVVRKKSEDVELPTYLEGLITVEWEDRKEHGNKQKLRDWLERIEPRRPEVGTDPALQAVAARLDRRLDDLEKLVKAGRCPTYQNCLLPSGLHHIHVRREDAYERMLRRLEQAKSSVDLLGIALRPFFHPGGLYHDRIAGLTLTRPAVRWRVLVLDPTCEQALFRSMREDPELYSGKTGGQASDRSHLRVGAADARFDRQLAESTLHGDVGTTIRTLNRWTRGHGDQPPARRNVAVRCYRGAPIGFAVIVDAESLFFELYHYGSRKEMKGAMERVSERVPVLEFAAPASMLDELRGHYDHLWDHLSLDPFDTQNSA